MGVSFSCKGGGKRTHNFDLRGLRLKDVAELSKSWNFEEASLGVAALNAWYARPELLDPLGASYDKPVEMPDGTIRKIDAFEMYRPRISAHDGARVTVIGHFPNVQRISEYAQLTVLERNCTSALDTPDPACEYVLAGSVVADPEKVRFAVKAGSGKLFGEALQMCAVTRPEK